MENFEEQTMQFSSKNQPLIKGINRIRYLKRKINNSYCMLKGINLVNRDDDQVEQFSAVSCEGGKQRGVFSSRRINGSGLKSILSERESKLSIRDNLLQTITNMKQKQKQNQFSSISKKQWNDNFFIQQPKSKRLIKRNSNSNIKLDSFYPNLLALNTSQSSNELTKMSLTELKKVNYNRMKKEKQQRKMKEQQQKENKLHERMKLREKVQLDEKIARKKHFLFMRQKNQELHNMKSQQKSKAYKRMHEEIKEQLMLQNLQSEKLRKFQRTLLLKQNLKKIMETRVYIQSNSNKNQMSKGDVTQESSEIQALVG